MTAMLIRCKLKRPGGTEVKMADGRLIHFRPDENGDHVALVSDPDHIQRLLSITEGYQIHAMNAPAVPVADLGGAKPAIVAFTSAEPVPAPGPEPFTFEPFMSDEPAKGFDEMTDDEIRGLFEAELKRKPHHNSKRETMIAQIEAVRAEVSTKG